MASASELTTCGAAQTLKLIGRVLQSVTSLTPPESPEPRAVVIQLLAPRQQNADGAAAGNGRGRNRKRTPKDCDNEGHRHSGLWPRVQSLPGQREEANMIQWPFGVQRNARSLFGAGDARTPRHAQATMQLWQPSVG